MQSQNRMFDDFVKVLNGAAGTVAGMTREAEAAFRERTRDWLQGQDMVGREEFEAVRAMAAAARDENAALRVRIEALEAAATDAPMSSKRAAKNNKGAGEGAV